MTISSATRKAGPFTGNGVTVAFPFTFKVFSATDLVVTQAVIATGAETILVLTTNYTVVLNADQNANPGGTVTMLAVPAATTSLTLTTSLAYLQPVDLTNQGGFYPSVINAALDRLTIFVQQLAELLGRNLKVPVSTPAGVNLTLPAPAPYTLFGWDAAGTSLISLPAMSGTNLFVSPVIKGTATAENISVSGAAIADNLSFSGPSSILNVPVGTTAQRPTGATGQIRYNTVFKSYEGYSGSAWASLGGGATGAGGDTVFVQNSNAITTSYAIPSNQNASSVGPITVPSGVTITVPSGSRWVVL